MRADLSAAWAVARSEIRRDRVRLVALSALAAIVGGVVIATTLGAERSRTSLDRFVTATNAADVAVFGEGELPTDELAGIDGVQAVSPFRIVAFMPTALLGRDDVFVPFVDSFDGRIPRELNGVRVVAGELPPPEATDRIALHEATAELLGVDVGDDIELIGFTDADIEQLYGSDGDIAEPSGEVFEVRVAGLIRDPLDVVARPDDIVLTPVPSGMVDRHGDGVGSLGAGAFVDLGPGTDVETFTSAARDLGVELQFERWIGSTQVSETGFGPTLDVIGDGLLGLAAVLAIAGIVVVGQALWRTAVAARRLDAALSAVGLARRGRLLALVLPHALVALGAGIASVPIAYVLSGRFPVGLARRAEPEPGMQFDPWILAGATVLLLVLLVLVVGSAAAGLRGARPAPTGPRLVWTPGIVGRAVSASARHLGRSTRAAVLVGAVGVTAALVFGASLARLLDTPAHYGWPFDTTLAAESFDATAVADGVDLAADPAVAEVAETVFQIELDVEGSPNFGFAIGDGSGEIVPVVAEGRAPRTADEVALGRETLRRLGRSIGDQVEITAAQSSARYEIVGQAIIPVSSDGNMNVGDGVTMSLPAAQRLGVDPKTTCELDGSCYRQTAVRFHEGADLEAARRRILADSTAEFDTPAPPAEVQRLDEVESIPWVLAGLLGVLAVAATAHAIVDTAVRRRRDLAVLRSLGATPTDARRGVTAHAVSLVVGAAMVGTLLGIVAGRALWRSVAIAVGVVASPSVPLVVALVPAAAVLLALVAALLPARAAGGLRPAEILRTE